MELNLNFVLETYEVNDMPEDVGYGEGQRDPQDLLLTPRELGDAIVAFFKALDAKGQLQDPCIQLPYHNDDTEDIFKVIKQGMEDTRHVPYVQLMDIDGVRVIDQHN
jgi:hypothetical protein